MTVDDPTERLARVDPRFAGAPIPDPGFSGDDGSADPAVGAALSAFVRGPGADSARAALAALSASRLLVPVVAVLEEAQTGADGLASEKQSAMATVTVAGPDGRRALLAFTSTQALARWRADARPVAVWAAQAARAALNERADTLLVDCAGPAPFAVAGAELRALAFGADRGLAPADDPDLIAAVRTCLAGDSRVRDVQVVSDSRGTTVVLGVAAGLARAELDEVVARASAALAGDLVLRARLTAGVTLSVRFSDRPDAAQTPDLVTRPSPS